MAKRFEIKTKSAHIDGTSISVQGKYLQPSEEKVEQSSSVEELLDKASPQVDGQKKEEEDGELVPITITHGYSRDHRPDLKQYTLNLLTAEEEGIPLFMQLGDGNQLDKNANALMIKDFKDQWQGEEPDVYVMDAAFYTKENLNDFQYSIKWKSPRTIHSESCP